MLKKYLIAFHFLSILSAAFGQSHNHGDSIHRDTQFMIIDNKVKSKFWGNSWHFPMGYTIGSSHDFEIGLGRSYKRNFCGGAGCIFETNSWGMGYGLSSKDGILTQSARFYYGYNFFYFPPFSAGLRGDYVYDLTNQVHYLKPSLGFSFIVGELFYSYGIKLNDGNRSLPSHGFTVRINLFYPMKKWEEHHPNRC
jgi:hypothetical protein